MGTDEGPIQIVGWGFFPLPGERKRLREREASRMARMKELLGATQKSEPSEATVGLSEQVSAVPVPKARESSTSDNFVENEDPQPGADPDLFWFSEASLSNALRLETYIQDAERNGDNELAELFRKAQADSRKDAEQVRALLESRKQG